MATISDLFPRTRKTSYDVRSLLSSPQTFSPSTLSLHLSELDAQLRGLDGMVNREPMESREMWRRRVSELRAEAAEMRRRGEEMEREYMREAHDREREELLMRGERSLRNRGGPKGGEDERGLDAMLDEGRSLDNSANLVASMIAQGSASLER